MLEHHRQPLETSVKKNNIELYETESIVYMNKHFVEKKILLQNYNLHTCTCTLSRDLILLVYMSLLYTMGSANCHSVNIIK